MALTTGDFIELDYSGKLRDDGTLFDTTIESVAKEAGLNPKAEYKPTIICLGHGQLLRGLDTFLEGKEPGKHTVKLSPEEAFGKKDPKLLKLIPLKKFKEAKIEPYPGLDVNIDNHYGVVRSVSGGRVTVDFNHPLAGKELTYELEVKRKVEAPEEQVAALLDLAGVHHHGVTMEDEGEAVIAVHQALPQQVAESLNEMITKLTGIETVTYHVEAGHDH